MKYIVILGDGMADYPLKELEGKTPLQYAYTPNIDFLALKGEVGIVKTIPEGMPIGSDTANLSLLGYNPREYYSGRSPFEAYSMGVDLKDSDITFRCNFVTLSQEANYDEKTIIDYCADEITTEESEVLIRCINRHLSTNEIDFYNGTSYKNLMVLHKSLWGFQLTPPHDLTGKKIKEYLPKGCSKDILLNLMKESFNLLKDHPVNRARLEKGLNPANSIWLWGEGKKTALTKFEDKYKIKASIISGVDVIKGIGMCAGMKVAKVEGATGNINTNFLGKAEAAIEELQQGQDFVYVHIEAPDGCGHRFEIDNKVKAIEFIDDLVVKPIKEKMDKIGEEYKIMVLPDHPTPLNLGTHTGDPVPFLIYKNSDIKENNLKYDEIHAIQSSLKFEEGYKLLDYFLER